MNIFNEILFGKQRIFKDSSFLQCLLFLFRSSTCQNTQLELATRFISLAFLGNKQKSRYIMGIELLCVDKMKLTELLQRSTNETSSPYEKMELMKDSSIRAEVSCSNRSLKQNACNFQSFRLALHNSFTIQIPSIKVNLDQINEKVLDLMKNLNVNAEYTIKVCVFLPYTFNLLIFCFCRKMLVLFIFVYC